MFQEAFGKLDLEEVAIIIDRVNPLLQGIQFDPVEAEIMAINISFYPGWRLLDIADHSSMPASRRYVVYGPQKAFVLNFTNEPIYLLNRDVPISLTDDTIADYVRFFFSFVRGRHGRFLVSESVDDIAWKEDPPPAARKAIGKMIVPITIENKDAAGTFHIVSTMMFKDSLFKSKIHVTKDGFVTLSGEELLIEDMPVLDDTFGQ